LLESLRLSMNLSLKAITLLFCCVMMTVQYRAQQRRRAAATASNTNEEQPSSSSSTAFSSLFAATSASPTLYQRLGVSNDATAEQIRTAHRRMAMRYHPDKLLAAHCASGLSASASEQPSGGDSSTHDMFIAIQEAYEVLSDPFERKRYDYALMTGLTYTRLSSAMRNVHGRAADKQQQQQEQDSAPFPAYIRRRPAAFTSTTHSADYHDNGRGTDRSSSSTSSTPQPVRTSRSFSSIFRSPFVHGSPAPSTASAGGTGSPPYHSPASSPNTPPISPTGSFSFLSTPPSTPPAAPTAANHRSPATAAEAAGTLTSLVAVLLAEGSSSVASFVRWMAAALLTAILFPIRVALALLALAADRQRRMYDERQRMAEDEETRRRRVRDETSVGIYGWGAPSTEVR